MKEATGDMTMTIVVIVGVIAVLAIASQFIWPTIKNTILNKTENIEAYVEVVDNYKI